MLSLKHAVDIDAILSCMPKKIQALQNKIFIYCVASTCYRYTVLLVLTTDTNRLVDCSIRLIQLEPFVPL